MTAAVVIDVWNWPLATDGAQREQLPRLLSPDEQGRADRFVDASSRAEFIVARSGMRRILADYVGLRPQELIFEHNTAGKPSLAKIANCPHFSLSHSAGIAVLAVCRTFPIGVDIELIRPISEAIAQRFFSNAENLELSALPECERLSAFFRCWARKEALVKALGSGFLRDPRSFDVSIRSDEPPRLLRLDGEVDAAENWFLADYAPAEGMTGAIAARTGGRPATVTRRN